MPLFSEHISNMYYSGSPSYTSPSYGYKSSYTPLGTSYSASYLNPGGNYSSHSSLSSYSRSPLSSRWIPGMSRSYSPMLSTITERGTSSPLRINSPRRIPISKRTYGTPYESYIQRPININTADIDVSRDKYRHKPAEPSSPASLPPPHRDDLVDEKDNSPFMPRVDGKPEEGVDSSPGNQRSTIKRGRTVVRFHTIKRKDKDSPRKPIESTQPPNDEVNTSNAPDIPVDNVESEPKESLSWREKLSDDLAYVEKREKKSLGTKLVEKFIVKDANEKDIKIEKSTNDDKPQRDMTSGTFLPNFDDVPSTSKSPDRRCSMELLAEQANLLDTLIRGENLSTTSLDLSKVGVAGGQNKFNSSNSIKRRKTDSKGNPLKTTKSDHSLHDNLKSSLKGNKDSKLLTKGRSLKKSQSGGSICRLDSITELPKEPIHQELPAIEESRHSQKSEKITEPIEKPKTRTKITASVEITPPVSPLKFRIENVVVEEKHHKPKKEISFTYEIEDIPSQDIILQEPKTPLKRTKERSSVKKKYKKVIGPPDAESPEPEDGNFWDKIGKRETVYLINRKQHIEETKEKNQRLLSWFPEVEEASGISTDTNNTTDLIKISNDSRNQVSKLDFTKTRSESNELLPEAKNIEITETKTDQFKTVSKKLDRSKSSENIQKINLPSNNSSLKERKTKATTEPKYEIFVHNNTIPDNTPVTKNTKDNSPHKLDEELVKAISVSNKQSYQESEPKPSPEQIKEKTYKLNESTESKLGSIESDSDILTLPTISTEIEISKTEKTETNKPLLESVNPKISDSVEILQPTADIGSKSLSEENSMNGFNSTLKKITFTTTPVAQTQAKSNILNINKDSLPITENNDEQNDSYSTNKTCIDTTTTVELVTQSKEPSVKNKEIELVKDNSSPNMKQIIPENRSMKDSATQEITDGNLKKKIVRTVAKKVSEKKKDVKSEENNSASKNEICENCKKYVAPDSSKIKNLGVTSNHESTSSKLEQENEQVDANIKAENQINKQEVKTVLDYSVANSSDSNSKAASDIQVPIVIESKNIPNEIEASDLEQVKTVETMARQEKSGEEHKAEKETKESSKKLKAPSIKETAKLSPRKPIKEEKAVKPLIATPRPLQKRVPQVIHSSESSDSSSEEDSSDDEDSESSEDSAEFFECEVNPDGRTSTGSNDSGFDSSAPTSPASFLQIKKGGGDSPGPSSSNASLPVTDILERELEQSTAYGIFRKTGKFTPPARSIPRFRKYTIEDFQFIKVLGKGSFGKVLLAELRETEYYYAVKCLKKDVVLEDDDVECTLIERKVLALGTNHPYLCHLFATFQTDSHLFFVMEYLNGGDLMFHIQQSGRFPEARARFYGAEIVSGLKFLHKRGIVYRDLKLDNILLDFDGHVRIADFGMCKLQIYLDKTADTFCGTPDYMAPEIIKGLKYNQTVDWWSFGVLLYEMLIGQSPFSGCDEDELFWSICNEMPSYPRFLSREGLTILTRLLDKDARTRLGGTECMHGDIREQEFFHPVHWDKLERRELEAPFRPRVRHPLDTQYFDRAFTGERPRLTAVEPHVLRSMDQEPFRGFSYTNPNATDR